MNSNQRFYQDYEEFISAEKVEITEETKTVLNYYKELSKEDKSDFNKILRENKYFYL